MWSNRKVLTNELIVEFSDMVGSLDKVFEALASGPRRQILAYLAEAELSTSELAERFQMSAPAISRHLSVLENAGLVTSERKGQFVLYKLNADSLASTLTSYAMELCPVGRPLKRESRAAASKRRKAS
ncbi:metalloregulator ArsR/SmtB family transcription factor [Ideonella sp. DXS29W]|uniref:Metalloregulator ArsR/SmtB family transcription factor n=1 Tax=Ideonella lacteola TaxID=2984193 RepID=A0ABU9BN38_9BURK